MLEITHKRKVFTAQGM